KPIATKGCSLLPGPTQSVQDCRAQRHLHSFPTRRSSDLSSYCCLWVAANPLWCTGSQAKALAHHKVPSRRQHLCCYLLKRRSHTDRKSTRLNSSHDQISYAVFCLKKKRHIELSNVTIEQD